MQRTPETISAHVRSKAIRLRHGIRFANLPQRMRFARWGHLVGLATLCDRLPDNAEGLEVGSFAGESAVIFMECGVARLTCLDAWSLIRCEGPKRDRITAAEHSFDRVAADLPGIEKLRMRSAAGMKALLAQGRQFDFVYIDADHSFDGVKSDIQHARPLLRAGGVLCGHDYGRSFLPGVTRAVDDVLGGPDEVFRDYSWLKRLE